jgi:hypothetical protein
LHQLQLINILRKDSLYLPILPREPPPIQAAVLSYALSHTLHCAARSPPLVLPQVCGNADEGNCTPYKLPH